MEKIWNCEGIFFQGLSRHPVLSLSISELFSYSKTSNFPNTDFNGIFSGIIAEEVLYACDENTMGTIGGSGTGGELGLANPAVHFFRGLRHRNLSAIRHATQRGLHQLQQLHGGHGNEHGNQIKAKGAPLMIQGFRSNPKDPESHILFFDIEGLIGEKFTSLSSYFTFTLQVSFHDIAENIFR